MLALYGVEINLILLHSLIMLNLQQCDNSVNYSTMSNLHHITSVTCHMLLDLTPIPPTSANIRLGLMN